MVSTAPVTRSLYRTFLRTLARLSRPRKADFVNLRRLYRKQLREALLDGGLDEAALRAQVDRTLSLLSDSPWLLRSLSSLSYHHTPYPLPHTNNSSRLSHLSKRVHWDPQDPQAAGKAWERRRKEEASEFGRISRGVDDGLRRMWREVEEERGVWLGRIEGRRYGD
ncbi:hypothetical protein JCM10213_006928 [Rhodosporidiobolus nylandii]